MRLTTIIFDRAGSLVEHGSSALAVTLQEVFEEAGLPISMHEARQSMGIAQRAHGERP
jgi:phosphonoacetaldehyde hydrolase